MKHNLFLAAVLALLVGFSVGASAQQLDPSQNSMPFDDVVTFTSDLLNQFWDDLFTEYGLLYDVPSGFFWYNEAVMSNCGPTLPNNAFFCPADATIWFHYDFLLSLYNNIGDYAAAHVLAHEWAHFVQHLLGIENGGYTIFTELQADCFAGFFAAYADANGILDQGDIEEAVIISYQMGDPETMEWYEPNAHGTSDQRITAFVLGFEEGLFACNFENIGLIIQGEIFVSDQTEPQSRVEPNPLTVSPLTRGGHAYGLDIRANSANVHEITLEVFDTSGQRVFFDNTHSGALRFHGLSTSGQRLANGVYLYVITTHNRDGTIKRSEVKKLVIVR